MIISASFKFFKSYILKQGFRDGFYGLVISMNSAHSNFLKYVNYSFHYSTKIPRSDKTELT